ncbi:MAG: DEAD/DEAH box helicase [Alphaproteobacteria bacterium]|nr:DEAD/DEAH box helicase [Alphaproteobacteria bacterium]
MSFEELGLSENILKAIADCGYEKPTPIQEKAIPNILMMRDVVGLAQTGTGKTASFTLPMIEILHGGRAKARMPRSLILTPTRELAAQVAENFDTYGKYTKLSKALLTGGTSMGDQIKLLERGVDVLIATPGRLLDLFDRGQILLTDIKVLVIDEADRMLDMGFAVQLEKIFKYMPEQRQTLMFSATLPKNILKLSEKYLHNPKRVAVGETNVVARNIKQDVIRIEQDKKYNELMSQLHDRNGSVIVFVKTKYGADRMAKNLRRDGFASEALHGDLRQSKRDQVMQNFRKMNFRVLIATDIAARGLDVPHIEHVINYDLPQVAEDFIHRIGRTARAGAEGSAISFVSNQDGRKWHAIERLLNPNAANDKGSDRKSSKNAKFRRGKKRFHRGKKKAA